MIRIEKKRLDMAKCIYICFFCQFDGIIIIA